jgi:hypothetical protein
VGGCFNSFLQNARLKYSEIPRTAVGGRFRSFLERRNTAIQKPHARQWVDGSGLFYTHRDTKTRKYHPRQWVDGSSPFYTHRDSNTQKSHPRQWVDGSSPFYIHRDTKTRNTTHGSGWMVQVLSTYSATQDSYKSHPWQWVDRSSPHYRDCIMSKLGLVCTTNVPHTFHESHLGVSTPLLCLFPNASSATAVFCRQSRKRAQILNHRDFGKSRLPSSRTAALPKPTFGVC